MIFLNSLFVIMILSQDALSIDIKKLYFEKDLSEYCKRRVIPSIFLGSQVVEASAFILHFTELNLPYSCFISIRSEPGNNMIMALTLPGKEDLQKSCTEHSPQLLVYEIGETFGGYWGMVPESLLRPPPSEKIKYYTLKTTQGSTTETETETETETSTEHTEPATTTKTSVKDDSEDFIRVEVPLLDVSGHLVPGSEQPTLPFDVAEAFDYHYDVTPIPGEKYDTSILPLVQLSVRKQSDDGRREGQEPRYELEMIEEFTPDPRLTIPHLTPSKYRFNENRHMSFGRKKVTKNKRRKNFRITTTKNSKNTKYVFPTTIKTTKRNKLTHESWEIIDKLMEKLGHQQEYIKNSSKLAENIANMKRNYSIYLQPDLSLYNVSKSEIISALTTEKISALFTRSTTHSVSLNKKLDSKYENVKLTTEHKKESQNVPINNHSGQFTSQFISHATTESFSGNTNTIKMESQRNKTNHTEFIDFSKLKRKKRSIQAIEIWNAKPHNIPTRIQTSLTTQRPFNLADIQEFASMVEAKDDEMHGRIALRYLRQYVGPAIYNICGDPKVYKRHVFLFNSSRIVLSLQNFSLSSISVILTGAKTLLSNDMKCSDTQLECQVSGARVCVDSLAACDGVPNCGSYDIYDEDRLMCGITQGLQRYVYLAAFTFLALLLTLCYAVHYWLKRCIPKVAEAFFVYTDGFENILYLDSIMRAPGDTEDGSRFFYQGSEYRSQSTDFMHVSKKKVRSTRPFIKCFRKMFFCFRKKKVDEDLTFEYEDEMFELGVKKQYSLTQMELNNLNRTYKSTADSSMQTGESLEMAFFEKQCERKAMNIKTASNEKNGQEQSNLSDPPIMIHDSLITLDEPLPEDELSLLKFFRESRSASNDSIKLESKKTIDLKTRAAPTGEIEITNVALDTLLTRPGPSGVKPKPKFQTRKRLRFNEIATSIPTDELVDNEYDEVEHIRHGRQADKRRTHHLSTIKEDDDVVVKHKHFWESRGKKSPKKTISSLR